METAVIVKVAVSAAPYSIDKPYDYLVPEQLLDAAVPGVRVTVPFGRGNRTSEGVILARGEGEKTPRLKPLEAVLDQSPMLDEDGIALALWMRQRYFCTMFDAIKTILPAGLWYRLQENWFLADGLDRPAADELCSRIRRSPAVLDVLFASGGKAALDALQDACGAEVSVTLRAMEKAGAVRCETAARRQISDKNRRMAELAISAEDALAIVEPKRRSAPVRYEAVRLLAATGRASAADVCYLTGATMQTLRGLEKSGLLRLTEEEALRIPAEETVEPGAPIVLNEEQQAAFDGILSHITSGKAEAALLHGVTGSGKTQIYGHGAGAGDRSDSPNDAQIQVLLRQSSGNASQLTADDGTI